MNQETNNSGSTEITVKAQVISELRSYGSKAPKSKKDKAKSARAALAAIRMGREKQQPITTKKDASKEKKPHRDYGSHQGNKHVYDLVNETYANVDEIPDFIAVAIANAMTTLESKGGFIDVKAMKNECETKDEALDLQFRERYGNTLTESQALQLRKAKSANAFQYWTCEIKLTITASYQFDGSKSNGDGTYTNVVRSKRVYTAEMIPASWVEANLKVNEEITTLVKGAVASFTAQPLVYLEKPSSGRARFVTQQSRAKDLASGYSPPN